MKPIFNELWILNQSGTKIFQCPQKIDFIFIDRCFKAIEIIAKEIKDDFHVSIINLDKNTISMMKIPLNNASIYLIGIINENLIGKEKKIISSLKKISQLISASIPQCENIQINEYLINKLGTFVSTKLNKN